MCLQASCSGREILINRDSTVSGGYTILSLAKRSITRNSSFLPQIEFGLFAFDTGASMDGSGPKRERVKADFKTDEPKLETRAAFPSTLFLDDLIIPINAGNLEKKAFFAIPNPSTLIFDYLSFYSKSRIINPNNPIGHISSHLKRHIASSIICSGLNKCISSAGGFQMKFFARPRCPDADVAAAWLKHKIAACG